MPEVLISSPLCSDTDQVILPNYNPIQLNKLEKEILLVWLKVHGFQKDRDKIEMCGQNWVHTQCDEGHSKYVEMHCKSDFCPKCGQTGSAAHKRRSTRAMGRLIGLGVLGYAVFTLPEEVSNSESSVEALKHLSKKAWEIIQRNHETVGGMVRTHLMGNDDEKLHIHFNVLFPINNKHGIGKVPQDVLDKDNKEWTDVVNKYFKLDRKVTNMFYKFAYQVGRQIHQVKYVVRPIVTTTKFLNLSDENKHYVLSLKGWHNTRWFGKLSNSQYKKYLLSQGIDPTKNEEKDAALSTKCPVCNGKFRYIGVVHHSDLPRYDLRYADKGVMVDFAIHSALKDRAAPFPALGFNFLANSEK